MPDQNIVNINERLPVEATAMSVETLNHQVQLIQQVMKQVMKKDEHYGTIPGTNKPTLLKPGAEKLCLTFRLNPDYEIIEQTRDKEFIAYTVKCILKHINTGNVIASGIGSCNSRETKYRFRWESTGREVPKDYWKHRDQALLGGPGLKPLKIDGTYFIAERTENLNPWDLDNTLIKMACKRGLVAATLNATAASDIFTQDIEDFAETAAPAANDKKPKDPKFEQRPQEPSKDTDKAPGKPEPAKAPAATAEKLAEDEQREAITQIIDDMNLQPFERYMLQLRIDDAALTQKKAASLIRHWNDELDKRITLRQSDEKKYFRHIHNVIEKLMADYPNEFKEFTGVDAGDGVNDGT